MTVPDLLLKNQFGEQSNNFIIGGTSQLNCSFIVDSANGNGLGIRSLKGSGFAAVYMHTSVTPAVGNPNPAVGYIYVKMSKPHAGYQTGTFGYVAPVSGTPINISSGLSVGSVYVIVSVGTSTAANWQAIGLPVGIAPAVGVSFVATSASAGSGTGVVETIAASGSAVSHMEVVGDPNQMCNPSDGSGSQFLLVNLGPTNSSTTTLIAQAPADNTVIGLTFNMLRNPLPII